MTTVNIMLETISDVKKFVDIVTRCDFEVDLISGRYVVDAKSIMGIFSLDLTSPIRLEANCGPEEKFIRDIQEFVVK